MIETHTTSAGNHRQSGRGIRKKPISANISSQEKPVFLKTEDRPKMMPERNWMICLRIRRIGISAQVAGTARDKTCDTGRPSGGGQRATLTGIQPVGADLCVHPEGRPVASATGQNAVVYCSSDD
jgi:hypothetical protein